MIGLIINELVTNSLKYAFPDGRAGTIDVRLTSVGTEHVLTVRDNGIGKAAPFSDSTGFGQRLVQAMTNQLNGEYHAEGTDTGMLAIGFCDACSFGFVRPRRTRLRRSAGSS